MSKDSRRPPTRRPKSPKAGGKVAESGAQTYKIGEAAEMVGVKAYVLRFWETEFEMLRAGRTESKHRVYTPRDIDNLRLIKRLLHDERFTIEGAKRRLKELGGKSANARPSQPSKSEDAQLPLGLGDARLRRTLQDVRKELESIRTLLED